jgi:hypothetical protein
LVAIVPVYSGCGDFDEHFIRAANWNREGLELQHLRGDEDGLLMLRDGRF